MVQMTPQDQVIVKALPGNNVCCDCGMKSPQWASVSFGNVFCLECSGVHRSLGVHISFVRSIAMDSWTDKQLALMKTGGNKKCNDYLKSKGIDPRAPIKQKYESDAAQLYKEILKARVEGRPEPTSLPTKKPSPAPPSMNRPMASMSNTGSGDANGMERLAGETDQQYVARQTRLRDEARARMRAKFGGGGMGGVGSSTMQGIGSNPGYNPHSGGYGGAGGVDLDNVMAGVTSAFSSGISLVGTAAGNVSSFVQDDNTKAKISNLGNKASTYAGSFWSTLSSGVNQVATAVAMPDAGDDGLSSLQREFASHRPATSKYDGFGSDKYTSSTSSNFGGSTGALGGTPAPAMGGASLTEAPGLPGEDRNGIERLTGESDEQYVMRQTRLRDEAKARMAAKFGNGGLSSSSSSAMSTQRPAAAPSSGNFGGTIAQLPPPTTTTTYPKGMSLNSGSSTKPVAPRSGGLAPAPLSGTRTPPRKNSKDSLNSDDFFASFGA